MKPGPLTPAHIAWSDDGTPRSPDFDDAYHGRIGAREQARHVFLAGNGLPGRWANRRDFTIAETGFGLGHNFIATWAAWRDDPSRPARLHMVSIDAHPPRHDDLVRAHQGQPEGALAAQLVAAWPPLVPGLHRLDFEGGALRLLLAFGDVQALLPALGFSADAFYLDGFAPDRNPVMWDLRVLKALGRRAAPGATAATWSVARSLRDGLTTAGFDCQRVPGPGGKRKMLRASHAPRHGVPTVTPVATTVTGERGAVVIGAGLAGACTAAALAALGFEVTVIDRLDRPAGGTSGNPAGLFHATVHADDGPHARLYRAAALHTARLLAGLSPTQVPHGGDGLLRLERSLTPEAMQVRIHRLGLPPDFVQALSAEAAGALAGVPLPSAAWFYPGGGWVDPAALVRERLSGPGIRFIGDTEAMALRRATDGLWQVLGAGHQVLTAAPHLVLANAEQAGPLLATVGLPLPALQRSRGQVSHFDGSPPLRLPLAGDGYALSWPGGLLCGATSQDADEDPALRDDDHRANFERLQRLCGLTAPADPARWQGRVGWRVQPVDRLPLAGPVPTQAHATTARHDQVRLLPHEQGLHLAIGLGARGLTLAPLLGELVAARIAGTPLPLEQALVDAVDPGRFAVRAFRAFRNRAA
jgi:tRNA 5-methylaminomethyl-2-thiouridine biosynthesis bifunctional protein